MTKAEEMDIVFRTTEYLHNTQSLPQSMVDRNYRHIIRDFLAAHSAQQKVIDDQAGEIEKLKYLLDGAIETLEDISAGQLVNQHYKSMAARVANIARTALMVKTTKKEN